MAKETDFIEKLSNFTESLEDLVDILKEQQKTKPTEVLNTMLGSMDNNIINIQEELTEIKKTNYEINKNINKILEEVKAKRKAEETGMFGEISDKNNKQKVVDGVKSILLIAGGVLAIGTAFKIVGNVDFFSVVALGMGILFIAKAFTQIATMKDDKGKPVTSKQLITAGLTMIGMSGVLLISGMILKNVPVLGFSELMTIGGIGLVLGLSTYLLLKGIGKLTPKQLELAPLTPIILPMIAAGVVGSAYILNEMPNVKMKSIIDALMVSVALAPITISFGILIKGLKDAKMTDLLFAGLAIVVIAGGLLGAAAILQVFNSIGDLDYKKIILAGLAVGAITLAVVPSIYFLKKANLLNQKSILDLAIGALAIVILSGAVMAASWILSVGNYDKYPDVDWSAGVGLAMLSFAIPTVGLGMLILATGGLGALALLAGAGAVVGIAGVMVGVAEVLNRYNWNDTKAPSIDWSKSVGLALMSFSSAILLSSGAGLLSGIMSFFGGDDEFGSSLYNVVDVIIGIAKRFNDTSDVDWDNAKHPSKEWSEGIGLSIMAFSSALKDINSIGSFLGFGGMSVEDFNKSIIGISATIIAIGGIFNENKMAFNDKNVPSKDWSTGVGGTIQAFASALKDFEDADIDADDVDDIKEAMVGLANSLIEVGKIFNGSAVKFDENNIPDENWSKRLETSLKAITNSISDDDQLDILEDLGKSLNKFIFYLNKNTLDLINAINLTVAINTIMNVLPTEEKLDPMWKLINALEKLSNIKFKSLNDLENVSDVISDLTNKLQELDQNKIDALSRIGAGLHIMSLVDNQKLLKTLEILDEKSDELKNIFDSGGNVLDNTLNDVKSFFTENTAEKPTLPKVDRIKQKSNFEDELIKYVKNVDAGIEKLNKLTQENNEKEDEEYLKSKNVEDSSWN